MRKEDDDFRKGVDAAKDDSIGWAMGQVRGIEEQFENEGQKVLFLLPSWRHVLAASGVFRFYRDKGFKCEVFSKEQDITRAYLQHSSFAKVISRVRREDYFRGVFLTRDEGSKYAILDYSKFLEDELTGKLSWYDHAFVMSGIDDADICYPEFEVHTDEEFLSKEERYKSGKTRVFIATNQEAEWDAVAEYVASKYPDVEVLTDKAHSVNRYILMRALSSDVVIGEFSAVSAFTVPFSGRRIFKYNAGDERWFYGVKNTCLFDSLNDSLFALIDETIQRKIGVIEDSCILFDGVIESLETTHVFEKANHKG